MTPLRKTLVAVIIAAAVGAVIYEARRVSNLQTQIHSLQQKEIASAEQIEQITRERDHALAGQATLQQENERARQTAADVRELQREIARLQASQRGGQATVAGQNAADPFTQSILGLAADASMLHQNLQQMPDRRIPELHFVTENDWLEATRDADLTSDIGVRKALSNLRSLAKNKFAPVLTHALDEYVKANSGQLPTDFSQLKPFFEIPVDDSVLSRYEMLRTGHVKDLPKDAWVISEKVPVDRDYDSHLYIGHGGRSGSYSTGIDAIGDPDENWTKR